MENVFIKNIKIEKVRHLENIDIQLDDNSKKHLIITGKNGSGKTSLLEAIRDYIHLSPSRIKNIPKLQRNISHQSNQLNNIKKQLILNPNSSELRIKEKGFLANIKTFNSQIDAYNKGINIFFSINDGFYQSNDFIYSYFDSKRVINLNIPKGIQKLELKDSYQIHEHPNTSFIQYIVNLKAERSFAKDDGDEKIVEKIDKWFFNFEKRLKDIFEDPNLELEFDRKKYNFYLKLKNGNRVDLNQLSDGYSTILSIVTDLILKMEKKSPVAYEMQGVVLIDEIETHLHVELQKKILPFLTSFFPNIQFIITTHSPFVISSVSDCVIYDLEKKFRLEDATGYSYDTIIESFYDSDKYSDEIKNKILIYEELVANRKNLDEEQKNELNKLTHYFDKIPLQFAPELEVKIQQIKLQKLRVND